MAPVFDGPVVPDGRREGCSGQHNGRGVEGSFLAGGPGSGRGGADQGAAADAHESRDEGGPFGAAQRAGWVEDLAKTVFLPVAGAVTAGGARGGGLRLGEGFWGVVQGWGGFLFLGGGGCAPRPLGLRC